MGNEPSRPYHEGMHPNSPGSAMMGGLTSPRTPTLRRSKSADAQKFPSPTMNDSNSSRPTTSSTSTTPNANNPKINRTIQKMDKQIRKRVRGGITYNMKILIRGAKGTGKTSLFQRLKGEPIPETHESTPQIQTAHINWNFKSNLEESVKCEVWDVVDRGYLPCDKENTNSDNETFNKQQQQDIVAASRAAAEAAEAEVHSGAIGGSTHFVATVDASTVDVYHETHGVIFLLDISQLHTLEYVKQELEKVPVHIPTLVLGNFRDVGQQRKVFKEDIQELLYGSDRVKVNRRPQELMYFECSLLNCYGLKSLHKYFGVPFLQLKLGTLRQQLRILEGDFVRLKHDVQTNIEEQRYGEYVEHIKATGSDIKTGRRVKKTSDGTTTPPLNHDEDVIAVQAPTDKKSNNMKEVVETGTKSEEEHVALEDESTTTVNNEKDVDDQEDLPERKTMDARRSSSLKIAYDPKEKQTQEQVDVTKLELPLPVSTETLSPTRKTTKKLPRKSSMEQAVSLEDFQFKTDLDNFYSEDESEEEEDDADVVVMQGPSTTMSSNKAHKQKFLDSDSEESDHEEEVEEKSSHEKEQQHKPAPPSSSSAASPPSSPRIPVTTRTQAELKSESPKKKQPLGKVAVEVPSHCSTQNLSKEGHINTPPSIPPITDSEMTKVVTAVEKPEVGEETNTSTSVPHDHVIAMKKKEMIHKQEVKSSSPRSTSSSHSNSLRIRMTRDVSNRKNSTESDKEIVSSPSPPLPKADLSAAVLSPKEKLDESFFDDKGSEEEDDMKPHLGTAPSDSVVVPKKVSTDRHHMIMSDEDDDPIEAHRNESNRDSSPKHVETKPQVVASPPISPVPSTLPSRPTLAPSPPDSPVMKRPLKTTPFPSPSSSAMVTTAFIPPGSPKMSYPSRSDLHASPVISPTFAASASSTIESTSTPMSPNETINEAFFDDDESGEDEATPKPQIVQASATLTAPVGKKSSGRREMVMSDEEPESSSGARQGMISPKVPLAPIVTSISASGPITTTAVTTNARSGGPQLFMIMSPKTTLDEGFFSDDDGPTLVDNAIEEAAKPNAVPVPHAPLGIKSELDGFFSDVDSETSPRVPVSTKKSPVVIDGDEEEDEEYIDRFAQYNRKKISSKSSRRKTKDLWSFNEPVTQDPEADTTKAGVLSGDNSDVMVAIRKAQEEALRMLEITESSGPIVQDTEKDHDHDTEKKKKKKKKKKEEECHSSRRKSSSSCSTRSKKHRDRHEE